MATIVVNKVLEQPITLYSHHFDVPRCPKCGAGLSSIRPWYLSESTARDDYGLEHEVLRVQCISCGYHICLMPCADAKKEG